MDKEIETAFVKNFIKKQYQDRLLYELNSDKKREDFIWRFSHKAEEIIDDKKIILKGTKITDFDIIRELNTRKINDSAYVISLKFLQGQILNRQEALAYCEGEYLPVIIMFANNLAFIKTEVDYGDPEKILVYK